MQFELRHTFNAPVDQVIQAMFDPALADHLKAHMKLIREIRPLERNESGGQVRRRIRYVPVPIIESVGPKKISPETLAWVEESTFDQAQKRISFKNIADHEKVRKHLENSGTITFREIAPGKTERTVAGELKVGNLPFLLKPLASIAERIIYSNAQDILNEEARAFGSFLTERQKTA